ncbi:hypothetical protein E2562_018679 [Oryza meyeriana var. granulata]|uniref:Protein kinase domain-containing protein n=1 Tax=Oryza meyeriana var. granulata TaxID=110450 RepID=A0A6G1EMQ4_9ORYZ|nr:hypothetical protein E2562_018679 [Oryza meyeriana var. granulata]
MTHLLWISLGLLLFSMHGTPPCSAANDTLTAGEELAVGDKLVSRNGRFTLGFFQPSVVKKLGGGGFGSVFKGVLSDSTIIAVKRLDGARQGEKQFRAEFSKFWD